MISKLPENRYKAAFLHLIGSCAVAAVAVFIVFFFWYPGLLASATGVTKIFLLVVIVDICLGPLLTLIVFDKKKPELKIDLAIIFAIQLAALVYGIHTVGSVRPVFLVFAIDRVEAVHANQLDSNLLKLAKHTEFQSLSYTGPRWAAATLPEDIEERNNLLVAASTGGRDLAQTPKYYSPYASSKAQIIEKSRPIKELLENNSDRGDVINRLKERYKLDLEKMKYLPLAAKKRDVSVLLKADSSEVLEIVDLSPW